MERGRKLSLKFEFATVKSQYTVKGQMGLAQENTTMLVGLGFQYTFPGYINNNKKHS